MTDRPEASPWLRLLGGLFVSASLAFSPQVLAQEESDDAAADEEEAPEEIVVTGSRLKRDTYSSISPLQIITGQVSREVGLIDAADAAPTVAGRLPEGLAAHAVGRDRADAGDRDPSASLRPPR